MSAVTSPVENGLAIHKSRRKAHYRQDPLATTTKNPFTSADLVVPQTVARHLKLGKQGEYLAAYYLKTRGFTVLSRNWRCPQGELDLVVTDGRVIVVCEVKTRSTLRFGDPAESVTKEKMKRIRGLAQEWLRSSHVGWCRLRFDVVAIYIPPGGKPMLRHIVGAF